MHELHGPCVEDLHTHLVLSGPEGVQPLFHNARETLIDPDERTLVISEIEHDGLIAEDARLHNELQVLMHQPRIPRRHDLQPELQERIEVPVHTRPEHGNRLALTEEQTPLMRLDLHSLKHVRYLL